MSWSDLWNSVVQMEPGLGDICLRLLCAMLVGMVIGTEREYTHRPAGMRTHILVALGACVVSVTGELLFRDYSAMGATPDPARLSAQVITGVGFLGAGTILREGATVKGLTTAASLWAVACLGTACGFGYYTLAILGMVLIFITLTIFERIQLRLMKTVKNDEVFVLETSDISASLNRIHTTASQEKGSAQILSAKNLESGHRVVFRADFGGRHNKNHRQRFFDTLASAPETVSFQQAGEDVRV
ncbi:MAG: MgtC/SapB family protein [Firmicutes bacterium]|nr:MgtC/SapB family protein [Bacillota bacterium]